MKSSTDNAYRSRVADHPMSIIFLVSWLSMSIRKEFVTNSEVHSSCLSHEDNNESSLNSDKRRFSFHISMLDSHPYSARSCLFSPRTNKKSPYEATKSSTVPVSSCNIQTTSVGMLFLLIRRIILTITNQQTHTHLWRSPAQSRIPLQTVNLSSRPAYETP